MIVLKLVKGFNAYVGNKIYGIMYPWIQRNRKEMKMRGETEGFAYEFLLNVEERIEEQAAESISP